MSTPVNRIIAALAALRVDDVIPDVEGATGIDSQLSGREPERAPIGLLRANVVPADHDPERVETPVATQDLLEAIAVFRRHDPERNAERAHRSHGRAGSAQKEGPSGHDLIRAADEERGELHARLRVANAGQDLGRAAEREADRVPNVVRRRQGEIQRTKNMVEAVDDPLARIVERAVEIEEDRLEPTWTGYLPRR